MTDDTGENREGGRHRSSHSGSAYAHHRMRTSTSDRRPARIAIDDHEPLDDYETDDFDDESEDFEQAFLDTPAEPPSPLSRKVKAWRMLPAVTFLTIAWCLSWSQWNGLTPDIFSLSGASIFQGHQYWRLVTSVLMHASPLHFFSNSLLLLVFGWFLYDYFGFLLFPVIALVCGIAANFTAVYTYPPEVSLVGASGMVYAMAGLWLVVFVRFHTGQYFGVKFIRAAGFALALLFPTTFSPEISYSAHAAGFFYGITAALFSMPLLRPKP